jgi:hypothetical protein
MSFAQPTPPKPRYDTRRRPSNNLSKPNDRSTRKKVEKLSQRVGKPPKWLKSLALMQKTTAIFGFLLLGATAGLYGLTYSIPQKWSQQYEELENLQRNERKLTAINETYKHQLSQEAQQKNSGLVAPTPEQVIFLKPTKVKNEKKEVIKAKNRAETDNSLVNAPFSY